MTPHFYTILHANPAAKARRVYLVGEGPNSHSLTAHVSCGKLCVYGEGEWMIPPGGNPAAELHKLLTEQPELIARQLVGETTVYDPELLLWQIREGEDITATTARVRLRNLDHLVLLDLIEFFVNARKNTT